MNAAYRRKQNSAENETTAAIPSFWKATLCSETNSSRGQLRHEFLH